MKRTATAQLRHSFIPESIRYLTGDFNYSYVYPEKGEKILSSRTLKWYADRWPHFIRVHKNVLVNPNHVDSVIRESSITAKIVMRDGVTHPVGRRRIEVVCALFHPAA